jgi:N utilization substance protein B
MISTKPEARRGARALVLQGLYQRQLSGNADDAIRLQLVESDGFAAADPDYLAELWRGTTGEYEALLGRIAPHSARATAALSPIERAILVIGAWELAHRVDVPYRVVIDEAVELAKDYGGTDGHRYVNGVLDKLAAELRGAEIAARGAESGVPR